MFKLSTESQFEKEKMNSDSVAVNGSTVPVFYLQVVLSSHHCVDVQLQFSQLNSMSLYDDVTGQQQLPDTL